MFRGAYCLSSGEDSIKKSQIWPFYADVCHTQTDIHIWGCKFIKGWADLIQEGREEFTKEIVIELRGKGNTEGHSVTKPLFSLLHKSVFQLGQCCSVSTKSENNSSSPLKKKRLIIEIKPIHLSVEQDTEHSWAFPLCFPIDIVKFIKSKWIDHPSYVKVMSLTKLFFSSHFLVTSIFLLIPLSPWKYICVKTLPWIEDGIRIQPTSRHPQIPYLRFFKNKNCILHWKFNSTVSVLPGFFSKIQLASSSPSVFSKPHSLNPFL